MGRKTKINTSLHILILIKYFTVEIYNFNLLERMHSHNEDRDITLFELHVHTRIFLQIHLVSCDKSTFRILLFMFISGNIADMNVSKILSVKVIF